MGLTTGDGGGAAGRVAWGRGLGLGTLEVLVPVEVEVFGFELSAVAD